MFNKKDYLNYFKQLYDVEIVMKKEVKELLKIVNEPEAKKILERIREDEIRHADIVKEMIKLI
jgi:rubrerythrin